MRLGEAVWECHRAKHWGRETGKGVSISVLSGQCKGVEVSPRFCGWLGVLLWSSCFAHPETGLAPIWDRAHWLLLGFRVAFIKRQGFLLRLPPRKMCGSASFTGPGLLIDAHSWVGSPLLAMDLRGWTVPAFCL